MHHRKRVTRPLALPKGDLISPMAASSSPINPTGLIFELASKYNQNNDVGVIRSWFRRNRIEAQTKHYNSLLGLVQEARAHTESLLDFRSELMTQTERIKNLILIKKEGLEFQVDRQRDEHSTSLSHQETIRESNSLQLEKQRLENERIDAENQKIFWEGQQNRQKAILMELRGKLIAKIIDDLDFKDINMKQVFVLIEMIKDTETNADVFTAEAKWEHLKAEADIKRAHANQEDINTEHKKYKFERETKEYEDEV